MRRALLFLSPLPFVMARLDPAIHAGDVAGQEQRVPLAVARNLSRRGRRTQKRRRLERAKGRSPKSLRRLALQRKCTFRQEI